MEDKTNVSNKFVLIFASIGSEVYERSENRKKSSHDHVPFYIIQLVASHRGCISVGGKRRKKEKTTKSRTSDLIEHYPSNPLLYHLPPLLLSKE